MPQWLELTIFGITLFCMLIGLFGLFVPLFPGIIIIWLASLGYGLVRGFGILGGVIFGFLTLLMVAGVVADDFIKGAGARWGGASWASLGWAILAGIAGTILLPPLGGLIGAPLAILLHEYIRIRDWRKAFIALRGMLLGYGAGYIFRLGIGAFMILLWFIWAWKG
jgi:uncharacterized protein YqgC (DUF456 family)